MHCGPCLGIALVARLLRTPVDYRVTMVAISDPARVRTGLR